MSVHEYFLRHSVLRTIKYVWRINFFFSSFFRATLMDSKTVDQLVIWRAGRQQDFSRPLDIIHPTTRLWQPMGKLSQLIYQKLLLQYLKQAFETICILQNIRLLPAKGVDNRKIAIYHVMSFIAIFSNHKLQLREPHKLFNLFHRFVFWQPKWRMFYPFDWTRLQYFFGRGWENSPSDVKKIKGNETAMKRRKNWRRKSGRKRFSGLVL